MLERVDISNQMYGRESVSVALTWSSNTGVDNYTVSVLFQPQSGYAMFNVNITSLSLSLQYNTAYSISITASNCAGRSNSFNTSFIIGVLILVVDGKYGIAIIDLRWLQ